MDFHEHAGTLELVNTVAIQSIQRQYVTHTFHGIAQQEWSVCWVPLQHRTRPVTIYAAGNAASGNGTSYGDHIYRGAFTMTSVLSGIGIAGKDSLSPALVLEYAYPSPFFEEATICFVLQESALVRISVYDVLGRRVWLLDLGVRPSMAAVLLCARDLAPGLYLYEVYIPQERKVRPMMVLP